MPPLAQAASAARSESLGLTRPPAWMPVVLVAVSLAAYWNSFGGAFVFDDDYRIVDNPLIRRLWPPWDLVARSSRPVVDLSLAVNYALNGLNVTGFHAVNLTVHLLAGFALYGIVRRMLGSDRGARYGRRRRGSPCASAAIGWHTRSRHKSVTYIIERAESLMVLFICYALLCDPWIRIAASGLVVRRVDRRLRARHGHQGGHGVRADHGAAL